VAVKDRVLAALQIGEEAADPRCEMLFEEVAIGSIRPGQLAAHEARHDFAQRRGAILGLIVAFDALDAELREIGSQPRQRALMQEASQVVGRVGKEFAAREADEQVEEFAFDLLDRNLLSAFGKADMRNAERRCVTA
jgi:hypothetical protein